MRLTKEQKRVLVVYLASLFYSTTFLNAQTLGSELYNVVYNEQAKIVSYNEIHHSLSVTSLGTCSELQGCLGILEINADDLQEYHLTLFDSIRPGALRGDILLNDEAFILGSRGLAPDSSAYLYRLNKQGLFQDWKKEETFRVHLDGERVITRAFRILSNGNWFFGTFTDAPALQEIDWFLVWDPEADTMVWVDFPERPENRGFTDYWDFEVTQDGGILVSGKTQMADYPFHWFPFLMRYDAEGNLLWHKELFEVKERNTDAGSGLVIDEYGNIYIGGEVVADSLPAWFAPYNIIYKLDPNGEILWTHTIAEEWGDFNYGITDFNTSTSGGIIGVGTGWNWQVNEDLNVQTPGWIFRLSSEGEMLWSHRYYHEVFDGEQYYPNCWLNDVIELPNGNITAVGMSSDSTRLDNGDLVSDLDVWVIQVDSNGCLEPGCNSEEDQIYTSIVEIPEVGEVEYQVFPNPFSEVFMLRMEKNCIECSFHLYDQQGREVYMKPGLYEGTEQYILSGLKSGLYVYNIRHRGRVIAIGKLIRINNE